MRTGRLLLVPVLAIALVGVACSREQSNPLDPQTPVISASKGASGGVQLIECDPLPAQTSSATIGILGGVINIGPHRLLVPPGALLAPKTITARIVAGDSTNSVQFAPEGLRFTAAALLSLSYDNCKHKGMFKKMQVVYTSGDLRNILELLPSIDNPIKKSVTATIAHFSRYAIAY